MVTCSVNALKMSSKKKETRIKNEIFKVVQQFGYRKKRTGNKKIGVMKGFNLVIWNFQLPSEFLYALMSYSKNSLLYTKNIAFYWKLGTAYFAQQTVA